MTRSNTAVRQDAPAIAQQPAGGAVALIGAPRLPYHPLVQERFGVDQAGWRALVDAVWPAAKTSDAIVLALSYCKARKLDPFKRPVHIVPIWSKELGRMVESVWPGIGELRTTAFRTGLYAGKDEPVFGPEHTATLDGVQVTYPEWCKVTVYRLAANGERVAYPGPTVRWRETYATAKRDTIAPNEMWRKRPYGQVEKCAEAGALRAAFPEEIGHDYIPEEIEGSGSAEARPIGPIPPRPTREEFQPSPSVTDAETSVSYIVVDLDGEEHKFTSAHDAANSIVTMFREAARRGRSAVDAVRENNLTATAALRDAGEGQLVDEVTEAWNEAAQATTVEPDRQREAPPASPPPAEQVDHSWLRAIADLKPIDLAGDELNWNGYAQAFVALCAKANAATRGALQTRNLPHLQKLRTEYGDGYRAAMAALSGARNG